MLQPIRGLRGFEARLHEIIGNRNTRELRPGGNVFRLRKEIIADRGVGVDLVDGVGGSIVDDSLCRYSRGCGELHLGEKGEEWDWSVSRLHAQENSNSHAEKSNFPHLPLFL